LIPNSYLTEADIPSEESRWDEDPGIGRFAATFNGYQDWGSFEKCADVADIHAKDLRALTLTELRTSLFFYFRALNHASFEDVTLEHDQYGQVILTQIRDRAGVAQSLSHSLVLPDDSLEHLDTPPASSVRVGGRAAAESHKAD